MNRLILASSTSNTHKTYRTGWRAFCSFKHNGFVENSPASPEDVRHFIAWLSLQGLAPSTIATYVAGVGYHHKIRSWPDPTHDFLVTKLLAGCRRDNSGSDTRWPMTVPVLARTVQALTHICNDHYEVTLFRAVMLSAFFGFMRIGEFAAISKTHIQNSLLLSSDVQFQDLGEANASVLISFRHAKNNPTGPPQVVRLVRSADESICPVQALSVFAQIRPKVPGSFFCHFGGEALTQYQFNATLKKVLLFLGLEESPFRAHSFRIGAASTAAALGIPLGEIKEMGRWRSEAAQLYIRPLIQCKLPGV
ncbi:uncharacterized protein LOC119723727 [Patiria miniata]|uniref:Tyr recombinase domain-containing protein n=1 Tax=Patiria miniata TaxID=46514 RepID=A0A913ZHG7_PATMI|nr:uncharacterized protein LOC119723727 [Patiria miniata]